ncbi:hypothetical protein ETI06_12795 [Macrococcoides goetzii]|nr:DUF2231 domain-containing protein [Macrococcus goetzii]TDM39198.1 hypothetical protein ETI10_11910 [Macrococcus goetzii]TDM40083.1 hypothetical protein ETI08_13155 [Macrococcus goetzii]TDM45792.1 hypothetical protein ETI06_12795 [Macrococcus goetzii]
MPLHPLVVHFPIALLLVGTLFEIVSLKYRKQLNLAGTILLALGFVSGVVAFLTGDSGERFAEMHFGEVENLIHQHEDMARNAMIMFGLAVALKAFTHFNAKYQKQIYIAVIIIAIIGSALLAYAGHLGGQIVYENAKILNQ